MGFFDEDDTSQETAATVVNTDAQKEVVQEYALDYVLVMERYQAAKASLTEAEEALIAAIPAEMREVGTHSLQTDRLFIQSAVTERWSWDQSVLKEIVQSDEAELPSCVDFNFKVSKSKFDSANEPERQVLGAALTRKAGKPKFKIEAI